MTKIYIIVAVIVNPTLKSRFMQEIAGLVRF